MLLINAHASNEVFKHRLRYVSEEGEDDDCAGAERDVSLSARSLPGQRHSQQPVVSRDIGARYYHTTTSEYMPVELSLSPEATSGISPGVLLLSMPRDVVYYVMEFMVSVNE